jgi:hypothetical protein
MNKLFRNKMNYKELKLKESKHLMISAWSLEITFCIIGLAVAISLSTQGMKDFNLSSMLSPVILVGFLPLLAIAFAELTKIPLVKGFLLAKSAVTKVFAGFLLLLVCGMTFETMSTGLEQNITNREHEIKNKRIAVNQIGESIEVLSNKINSIENLSAKEIREDIDKGIQASLATINDDIESLKIREKEIKTNFNSTEVNELIRQLSTLEKSKEQKTDLFEKSLSQINKELLKLNEDEQSQLGKTTFFKGGIIDKFANRRDQIKADKDLLISKYDKTIKSIERKITTINNKIAKLSEPDTKTKKELSLIAKQIQNLIKDKNTIIKNANKSAETSIEIAKQNKLVINQLESQKALLSEDYAAARNELAVSAEDSVIHRMALKVFGVDHAADLTEDQTGLISLIFIFSIASFLALIGPGITFVAMKNLIEEHRSRRPTIRPAIRRVLISLRKRIMKPRIITQIEEVEVEKEVIKEIEVEKKVYEKVEVPTPYEITKFVGVPVPTDPKDLPLMPEINDSGLNRLIQGGKAA